jgi:hypothetical protein
LNALKNYIYGSYLKVKWSEVSEPCKILNNGDLDVYRSSGFPEKAECMIVDWVEPMSRWKDNK